MSFYKKIADFLTWSRVFISLYFLYAGIFLKRDAFPWVVMLVLYGWLSDALDGEFARASGKKSWIGEHEALVDIFFGTFLLFYLLLTRMVPLWIGVWVLIPGVLFLFKNSLHLGMLFMSLVYFILMLNIWFLGKWWLVPYGLYIVGALIFKWRRFKTQVHEFLGGFGLFKREEKENSYTYEEKEC